MPKEKGKVLEIIFQMKEDIVQFLNLLIKKVIG
jgi:hypothetical protein